MSHHRECQCYNCQRARDKALSRSVVTVFCVFVALVVAYCLAGCASTVAPDTVQASQASFDGGEQNSGILSEERGGFLVTPHFRDRFNALADTYGEAFAPAVTRDAGMSRRGGAWFIDADHMVFFVRMNAWAKSGIKPPHK